MRLMFSAGQRTPFVRQLNQSQCGLAALTSILLHYGYRYQQSDFLEHLLSSKEGIDLWKIYQLAADIGLQPMPYHSDTLPNHHQHYPCIAHWQHSHFVIIDRVNGNKASINDPKAGQYDLRIDEANRRFSGKLIYFTAEQPGLSKQWQIRACQLATNLQQVLCSIGKNWSAVITYTLSSILLTALILSIWRSNGMISPWHAVGMLGLVISLSLRYQLQQKSPPKMPKSFLNFVREVVYCPLQVLESRQPQELSARINSWFKAENILRWQNTVLPGQLILLAMFTLVQFWLSPLFTMISCILLIMEFWALHQIQNKAVIALQHFKTNMAELQQRLHLIFKYPQLRITAPSCEICYVINGQRENIYWEWGGATINFCCSIFAVLLFCSPQLRHATNLTPLNVSIVIACHFAVRRQLSQMVAKLPQFADGKAELEKLAELTIASKNYAATKIIPMALDPKLPHALELHQVNFAYGSLPILKAINLQISPGKKYAICGYNGSGKSTLLKIIAGVYHAQSGQIFLQQRPWQDGVCQLSPQFTTSLLAINTPQLVLIDEAITAPQNSLEILLWQQLLATPHTIIIATNHQAIIDLADDTYVIAA